MFLLHGKLCKTWNYLYIVLKTKKPPTSPKETSNKMVNVKN